jgi:hypothetical protein
MTARVMINPNLRLDDVYTMVDLDEDVEGELGAVFDTVIVQEPESGLIGKGWITEIDLVERTVTVLVDWANLTLSTGAAVVGGQAANRGELNRHVTVPRVTWRPRLPSNLPSVA